jgi:hypothetical protein
MRRRRSPGKRKRERYRDHLDEEGLKPFGDIRNSSSFDHSTEESAFDPIDVKGRLYSHLSCTTGSHLQRQVTEGRRLQFLQRHSPPQ